jgi:hypothetical protein
MTIRSRCRHNEIAGCGAQSISRQADRPIWRNCPRQCLGDADESSTAPVTTTNSEDSHVPTALIRRFHEAKVSGAPSVDVWRTGIPSRITPMTDSSTSAPARTTPLRTSPQAARCLQAVPGSRQRPVTIFSGVSRPMRGNSRRGPHGRWVPRPERTQRGLTAAVQSTLNTLRCHRSPS